MTLHEAIELLLKESGRNMTTQEIADQVNGRGLYTKRDRSEVTAFQVHGRTRKYDHMFTRDGSTVSLVSQINTSRPVSTARTVALDDGAEPSATTDAATRSDTDVSATQESLEQIRKQYLPDIVCALFVGESPPEAGTFFYKGNSRLYSYTREAFAKQLGVDYSTSDEFLRAFSSYGCYLDDLCLVPVNKLGDDERERQRRAGVEPEGFINLGHTFDYDNRALRTLI